jgi:hypothetical protein
MFGLKHTGAPTKIVQCDFVYLGIQIAGRFDAVIVSLPIQITKSSEQLFDGVKVSVDHEHNCIFIHDTRTEKEVSNKADWELRTLYVPGNLEVEEVRGRIKLWLPLAPFFASGELNGEGKYYPLVEKGTKLFIPEIRKLKFSVSVSADGYVPDPTTSAPFPEVIADNEMRWFSDGKQRHHSGVLASFANDAELESVDVRRFLHGVFVALYASLALTAGLDAIWTLTSSWSGIADSFDTILFWLDAIVDCTHKKMASDKSLG